MSATGTCEFQPKDYKSDLKPLWCPGCGDFSGVAGIYRALAAIGRPPHEIAFVSGIGCSSRIPGYTTAYGFNSVHGRCLPIAQGIKLANPDLLVLAAGGDGDGFSIGGGHIAHLIRRNMDITYIVMDNQIYGLTKGQLSPTSQKGRTTCTSRYGSLEEPVNPLLYVMGYGASYVAHPNAVKVCGCPVTQWGATGIVLTLDVWCADALTAITLKCDLLEQAIKCFAREGIGHPLPLTTVILKDDRRLDHPPAKSAAGENTP